LIVIVGLAANVTRWGIPVIPPALTLFKVTNAPPLLDRGMRVAPAAGGR
jgi:hypothetical protein